MSFSTVNRNKRARFGWVMYDWANSVYNLVITTAIFPIYFHATAEQVAVRTEVVDGASNAVVNFMGMEIKSISLMSLALSFSYILIAIASPLLGAIADYGGNKKKYMIAFCGIGSLGCSMMYFFEPSTFHLGFWLFAVAAFGYAGGNIFNDAFLPEIAEPKDFDKLSARGYSMGYIGSVLLLMFNLTLIMFPQWYFDVDSRYEEILAKGSGIDAETAMKMAKDSFAGIASRISFLTVGIWWFGFAQITFWSLKDVKPDYQPKNLIRKGVVELKGVLRQLNTLPLLKRYMLAFFFFNMGIQTVVYMASSFGTVELGMSSSELIISVLLIQFLGIAGAYALAWVSRKLGNFKALMIGIVIWMGVCIGAFFVEDANGFYVLAFFVGMVMGGMQALSRSTYSKLIPETRDTASFFSFFAIIDKIAIVFGTLTFGLVSNAIGTRYTLISLVAFFIIGILLLNNLSKDAPPLAGTEMKEKK